MWFVSCFGFPAFLVTPLSFFLVALAVSCTLRSVSPYEICCLFNISLIYLSGHILLSFVKINRFPLPMLWVCLHLGPAYTSIWQSCHELPRYGSCFPFQKVCFATMMHFFLRGSFLLRVTHFDYIWCFFFIFICLWLKIFIMVHQRTLWISTISNYFNCCMHTPVCLHCFVWSV